MANDFCVRVPRDWLEANHSVRYARKTAPSSVHFHFDKGCIIQSPIIRVFLADLCVPMLMQLILCTNFDTLHVCVCLFRMVLLLVS